jgi:hypothetical protein
MILVDTSVWIEVLRDKKGSVVQGFRKTIGTEIPVLTRFTQLELLQGAHDQREWNLLDDYLATQYYLEASENTWKAAARIFFELRRKRISIRSPIDCCIAQIALEAKVRLLHRDMDFERIATIRPLPLERF